MSGERSGVVVALGAQLAQIIVGVLTSILIGRALGPESYGLFGILRNTTLLALTVTPLGLDVALLKYLGAVESDAPAMAAIIERLRRLAFAMSATLWLAIVVVAGFGGIGRLYSFPHVDALAVLGLAAIPLLTDIAVLGAVYRAERRAARFAFLGIGAQSGFRLIAVPLALWLIPSTAAVVAIGTVQAALSCLLIRADRLGRAPTMAPAPVRAIVWILNDSLWMAMSMFVAALIRSGDLLFLGALAPAREVGAYAALSMVSQLIGVFPIAASQTLGPRVAEAYLNRAPDAVRRELSEYLSVVAPASAFLFAGVAAFGPQLDLVFGKAYSFDPLVCLLVPLGQLLNATLGPMGFGLSMTGRHRMENAILLAGGLVLTLGCALAVPIYGSRGAAVCAATAYSLVNLSRFALVCALHGGAPGRWRDLIAAPAALGLASICAAASLRWGGHDLASSALGCAAYCAAFSIAAWAVVSAPALRDFVARRATS